MNQAEWRAHLACRRGGMYWYDRTGVWWCDPWRAILKRLRKGGRVETKGQRLSPVIELARLIHESGRQAVASGKVYMKGPGVPRKPFCEWRSLPPDAIEGRLMMAKFLLDGRRRPTMWRLFR